MYEKFHEFYPNEDLLRQYIPEYYEYIDEQADQNDADEESKFQEDGNSPVDLGYFFKKMYAGHVGLMKSRQLDIMV